jgi:GrpB-like predicted nucleotidyltransferase (UPF0157 family)
MVCDYDPTWVALFEQERTQLSRVLGARMTAIEHVGSTTEPPARSQASVPGLAAKPIIALLVGVKSLPEARSCCLEPLSALGYAYIPEYESWLPEELFFRKGIGGPWTHHVHMMEPSSPRWEGFVVFRDYLRSHPEIAAAYGNLKKALALVFNEDIAAFRDAKSPFVQAVMMQARAWKASGERARIGTSSR